MNSLGIGLQQGSKTQTETQSLCDTGQDSICKKNLATTVHNFVYLILFLCLM